MKDVEVMEKEKNMIPEVLVANPVPLGSYASGTQLNCILYYSGGRPWYATVLDRKSTRLNSSHSH